MKPSVNPSAFKISPRRAKKRLGQHFLRDLSVVAKIVELAAPVAGETILEIGPGEGVLTEALLARAGRVIAVEADQDLWSPLSERFAARPGPVPELLPEPATGPAAGPEKKSVSGRGRETVAAADFYLEKGDFLKVDLEKLFLEKLQLSAPVAVVANIPYQITTPILFRLIKYRHLFSRAILMLQEEVAARLLAAPGGRDYGRLTVGVGLHCDINSGFKVAPGSFSPPPKVWSRVLRFEFLPQPRYKITDPALFERLLLKIFSQRRKQIINPLKGILTNLKRDEICAKLEAAGFTPEARPATLTPEEMVRLADRVGRWAKM